MEVELFQQMKLKEFLVKIHKYQKKYGKIYYKKLIQMVMDKYKLLLKIDFI